MTRTAFIEVRLSEFSDDDIIAECSERIAGGASGLSDNQVSDDVTEMYYAFKLGRDARAIEIAKKLAQDHTGLIL